MSRRAEQEIFESLRPLAEKFGSVRILDTVQVDDLNLPIWSLRLGPEKPDIPTFGLFGGVHGLERVGSHVVLHYLKALLNQMEWDKNLRDLFKEVRLVSVPMVNPGGLYASTRSNPNGVDIMRNAPVDSEEKGFRFVSGHDISPRLPWYRGNPLQMEKETSALVEFVRHEMLPAPFSLALDVHSGFGLRDRLWYPFSHSRNDFPYEPQVKRFSALLKDSLSHHVYKIEKQTDSYLIHGDPWDFVLLEHLRQADRHKTFIPWCLEMGSWTWLRKNPMQIFSKTGLFNPIQPHRYGRIMRRHRGLIDIFLRSTLNYQSWSKKWDDGLPSEALAAKAHIG